MPEKVLKDVAAKYHLTAEQAAQILRLLDDGYSIPYIRRYHKELAAGMEAEGFHELIEERRRLEKLESRRRKILKKLEERDILTDELRERIKQARDMRELIDYYVPYRPRKRSHSRQALGQGLRSLATQVLAQEEFIPDMGAAAEPYVDPEQGLEDVEGVLEGTFHIVSDWVAEEKAHRDRQREVFRREADLVARRAGRSLPGRLVREFRHYFDFREKAAKVHPYHVLCILRGKRMNALDYELEVPLDAMVEAAAELYLAGGAGQLEATRAEVRVILGEEETLGAGLRRLNGTEMLVACIEHSLNSILADVTAREVDKEMSRRAELLALDIIRRNLRAMLMAQPVRRRVLGIHPGYRTGCNVAALDEGGAVLETATVYPHTPQREVKEARETLKRLISEHEVAVVAIGDGMAVEETEALIGSLIADGLEAVQYTVVSEVGLDAYVNSRSAKNEMAEAGPGERSAVAVGRRLQDPLSELVKVNPRELCLEPYVDDVNGGLLKKLLDRTIEECVGEVGADANRAHYSLLRYVSGLGPDRALELVDYRERRGPIKNRAELREVPKIDQESFDRAAGFIRVAESDNPLDLTRIHPRFYAAAEEICRQLEIPMEELGTEEGRQRVKEHASEVKLTELEKQFEVHYLLLKDIVSELCEPWPDPRMDGEGPAPVLRDRKLTIEDLEPGQWFTATVRNIVDFGVFADIGVGEDGLIHISELSEGYVESPYDVVCVGDRVRVQVVRVDIEKRRIALSMVPESSRRERRPREGRRRPREEHRAQAPRRDVPVPAKPEGAAPTPKSTVGWESRRVKRAQLSEPLSKTQQQILRKAEPEPAPGPKEEPAEAQEEKGAEAAEDVSGLLKNLDFASIERRGEAKE